MGRKVTIKISGIGVDTDAPKAEDLLDQLYDFVETLRGVETAVADGDKQEIVWRVVNASKKSPIGFELEAFPVNPAMNIEHRVSEVLSLTTLGFNSLHDSAERPFCFTDPVLKRVERIFDRMKRGLSLTEITADDLPPVVITHSFAATAVSNLKFAMTPPDNPYKEFGSVEGYFSRLERDGHRRPLLWITTRLTGLRVKCILQAQALEKAQNLKGADVLAARRTLVVGIIHYHGLGRISEVHASDLQFLRSRNDLPGPDDIIDENFTDGLATEEYLGRLRDGGFT
jgi:hypothetical protein